MQEKYKISLKPLNEPIKSQNMVLMKKLKSNLNRKEIDLNKKITESNMNISMLNAEEMIIFEGLKFIRSSSAPFIKEFITPMRCKVFVLCNNIEEAHELKMALEDPARPLYIGSSDDFVIVSNIEISDTKETTSSKIDSIIRLSDSIEPIDKRRIIGRIPYKFKEINIRRRDYSREDAIVAVPIPGAFLELNEPVRCYQIGDEKIAF